MRPVLSGLPGVLTAICIVALCEPFQVACLAAEQRPNIIYIMADDLGIGDVHCYGGNRCQIETPHIDRLASEGMRFTDAHTVASHCIPTRVAIMTGRYPWRFKRPQPDGPWGFLNPRLAVHTPTLGRMLNQAGYHTSYIGKWHLGTLMTTTDEKNQGPDNVDYTQPLKIGPHDYGFDDSFILPGSLDMYPYVYVRNHRFVGEVTEQRGWSAFNRVGPTAKGFEDVDVLDTFCREVESYLQRRATDNSDQPFFLYFALTSPHTPTSPSPRFQGTSKLGLYGDFVAETDDCVGRVLQALKKCQLEENTLVLFTSDHGAASYAGNIRKATANQLQQLEDLGHFSSGPYRGYKFSIYEGGLRVPFVARWPGKVPAGTHSDRLLGLHDLMATCAELAACELPPDAAPDSISFAPLLNDPQAQPTRDTMVMQSTRAYTLRAGDWKLAVCPGSGSDGRFASDPPAQQAWRKALDALGRVPKRTDLRTASFVQLFNLKDDPGETNNLAASHSQHLERFFHLWDKHIAEGRTTAGPALENDRQINLHAGVPRFVWEAKANP